jgi:hypothetical protein
MKKIVVAALLAVGIIGGSLPSVAAAASSGAIKIADQHCHTEPDGVTTCFAVAGVATETSTPAGNTSYTGNMRTTFAAYDAAGTLLATTTGRNHAVRLFTDGGEQVQVLSERLSSTTTLADGSACTATYTMQYVHGEIRFHTVEHVCH